MVRSSKFCAPEAVNTDTATVVISVEVGSVPLSVKTNPFTPTVKVSAGTLNCPERFPFASIINGVARFPYPVS